MLQPADRTYKTTDGTELPMRVWAACPGNGGLGMPPREAAPPRTRAAVVYLHGIQSHSGWYEASSRLLAERGAAVYQVERRGSGIDRLHERGHVDRAETWLQDVAAAADLARRETGVASVHLLGVSWGGKLALACAAHRPDLYRSLILAAPGQCLLVGRPLARFPIPLGDPYLFTENPERVRFIAEDSLSLHDLTARFMYESRRLDGLARSAARGVRLPVFLALAGKDRIIDNAATRALVEAMPSVRRRIAEYPGACHTLEFEAAPSAWFRDLAAWIDEVESG
jgi:alpha-beta hydrolase superfamily lysophospholipase